jgi:hypothetical protein
MEYKEGRTGFGTRSKRNSRLGCIDIGIYSNAIMSLWSIRDTERMQNRIFNRFCCVYVYDKMSII